MDEAPLAKGILLRLPSWEGSAVDEVAGVSVILCVSHSLAQMIPHIPCCALASANSSMCTCCLLVEARKLTTSREILLWMTPSEAPKALQASECSELLDPMKASCWISAQH